MVEDIAMMCEEILQHIDVSKADNKDGTDFGWWMGGRICSTNERKVAGEDGMVHRIGLCPI